MPLCLWLSSKNQANLINLKIIIYHLIFAMLHNSNINLTQRNRTMEQHKRSHISKSINVTITWTSTSPLPLNFGSMTKGCVTLMETKRITKKIQTTVDIKSNWNPNICTFAFLSFLTKASSVYIYFRWFWKATIPLPKLMLSTKLEEDEV
jgi:hypothetical protein